MFSCLNRLAWRLACALLARKSMPSNGSKTSSDRPPARSDIPDKPETFERAADAAPALEPAPLVLDPESAAAIAHHVKNPLAGIRGAVEFLGARLPGDDDGRDVVRKIVSRIDELDSSLDALLLFLRPPPPRLGRVDLRALVEPLADENGPARSRPSVSIALSGDRVVVNADERQLQRLVRAVLTNAAEATREGSALVEVRITRGPRFVTVSFRDHGPGIDEDILPRVCEPFFTTKPRALGLGLTIAKRTARMHGGWLTVSPRQRSTEIQLTLPVR